LIHGIFMSRSSTLFNTGLIILIVVGVLGPAVAQAQEAVILLPDFQIEAEQGSNRVVRAARSGGVAQAIADAIAADADFTVLMGDGLARAASLAGVREMGSYCQTRTSMEVESVLGADFVLCVELLELSPSQGYRLALTLYGGQIRMHSLIEKAFIDAGNEQSLYTAAGALTRKLLARVEPSPVRALSQLPTRDNATSAASAELGQLLVTSEPVGAMVRLNATPIGTTPFRMDVPAGRYLVTVESTGFEERVERVDVQRGGISTLQARLVPMGVRITLESAPSGAQVYANGTPIGETPIARAIVSAPTGALTLVLVKPGFVTRTLNVQVQAGDAVVDRIDLQPLSSTVLVKTYEFNEILVIDGNKRLHVRNPGVTELYGLSDGPHRLQALPLDNRPEVIVHFEVPHAGVLHVSAQRGTDGLRIVDVDAIRASHPGAEGLDGGSRAQFAQTGGSTGNSPLRMSVGLGVLHALGTDHVGGAVGVDYEVLEHDHGQLRIGGLVDIQSGQQSYHLTDSLESDQLIRPRVTVIYDLRWGPLTAGPDLGLGTVFPVHAVVGAVGAHLGLAIAHGVEMRLSGSYEPAMFRDVVDWNAWGTNVGIGRDF